MQTLKAMASTVNTLIQAGDFEQAMSLVEDAIRAQPEVGEIRRVAGSIAISLEEYDTAKQHLREAAARGADRAYLLGDKACLNLALGKLKLAKKQAASAVRMKGDSASLQVIRARVAAEAGVLNVEKRSYERALQIHPNLSTAALGLARAYRKDNSDPRALDVLKDVLLRTPDAPGLFWQILQWCAEDDTFEWALELADELVSQYPESSNAWLYLGYVHLRLDDLDGAIVDLQRSVQLDSSAMRPRLALGNALIQERRMHEAVGVLSEGFDEENPDLEAGLVLAQAFEGLGKQHSAHTLYARLSAAQPDDPRVALGLARHTGDGGNFDAALAKYDELLKIPKHRSDALVGKAALLGKQGLTTDAVAILDSILAEEPTHIAALASRIHFATRGHAAADHVVESAESIALTSVVKQPTLMFALGALRHRQSAPAAAFEWFRLANEASGISFNAEKTAAYFDRLKQQYPGPAGSKTVSDENGGEPVVFMVGMPRSGTSLTEQALAMHPQVSGGGELSILPSIVRLIPPILQSDVQYPEYTSELTVENLGELGHEYLDNVAEIRGESRFVTDKLPHNFMHVGFISQILPQATVLHCRRNPMDNCLSLFQTFFAGQHTYAYALDTIAAYYRMYDDLMKHWRAVGMNVIDVPYERTVDDLEGTMRGLCERLDLEWAPEILSFHQSSRVVMTASNAQVTKPLYASSIGRWKVYEKQLAPLREALDDICTAYAAEVPEAAASI